MTNRGSDYKITQTTSWFKAFKERVKLALYCFRQKHYYVVALEPQKPNSAVHDIKIKTYCIDNSGVKDLSLFIYNNFSNMDALGNQVNDILNNPNHN